MCKKYLVTSACLETRDFTCPLLGRGEGDLDSTEDTTKADENAGPALRIH